MTAQIIWLAYLVLLFLLMSDMLGLPDVWLKTTRKIWNYFYSRTWGRVLMASLAYIVAIGLIFWWAGSKINFFKEQTLSVENWEDRRSFGLGVSGILLSWLAIIGAILSAARTKAMEETNQRQADAHNQKLYMDALETLNKARDYQKAGAIEALRKLGCQEGGDYYTDAIEILKSFIRSTARIVDGKPNRRANPEDTALNLASALHALSDLLMATDPPFAVFETGFETFDDLDFTQLTFNSGKTLARIHFRKCCFHKCNFTRVKFQDLNFWKCNFDGSILSRVHFKPGDAGFNISLDVSTFNDTWMHGTDFEHVYQIKPDQLRLVRYHGYSPPKNVPTIEIEENAAGEGILPPPFIPDEENKEIGSYLSIEETREFYSLNYGEGGHSFRPRHQDRTPVPIAHPDDPTNVILD